MTANILNGKKVAEKRYLLLESKVKTYQEQWDRSPCLAVIVVGEDPASLLYVQNKSKACQALQIHSKLYYLKENTSEKTLLALMQELNHSPLVDGILVQLPLPAHMETQKILEYISYKKDVDGFHPYNLGRLAQKNPLLRPCTPYGIIQLLQAYDISLQGKHAVILGASNIVGRPMALECLLQGATVTVCHRFTQELQSHVQKADILILATGKYNIVDTSWLHQKQIVIDVGIHRHPNGYIHGDIDFAAAKEKVAFITPVPGGVGPMTISTLLENTLIAANLCKE
jgi:methylenetetrahydrofolate dehydrogenase (NADP+)/methenyltetrahydrofolate cyclohydrolase